MNKLTTIFSLLFAINAFGSQTPKCQFFKNDPYENFATMAEGDYKGKCLETTTNRNFNVIEIKEDRSFVIANFFHKDKFWKATIPSGDIFKRAIIQVEYFPPEWIAAHTQIRFDLNEGETITLEGQNETNFGEVEKINSFVISFEALKAVDSIGYDLFKGTQDYFAFTVRMFSTLESYKKIVLTQKHQNEQIELNFNKKELKKLFDYYINRGQKNVDNQEMYHTVFNNCTTEIYEGFEFTRELPLIERDKKRFDRKVGRWVKVGKRYVSKPLPAFGRTKKMLPVNAKWYADFREITKGFIAPLEEEFNSVEDFEIQK